jgi:hypothetical protein
VSEQEQDLRVAREALWWLATHVIGEGGTAAWRVQLAARLAAEGREDWREPLTRPAPRKPRRDDAPEE